MATVSVGGEDSDGEESNLSKVLASRRMNTDDFDPINLASQRMNTDGSAINPILIGLGGGSRKSYHQPIFTLVPSAHHLLMLLLDQATLDSTATAQASAAQDFHSHASPSAQAPSGKAEITN